MASVVGCGGNRWLQFLNNGGRGRSRDQIILISFFKFRLLYHITSLVDVFNHCFWKLYIKTINDLDPGLNLPEFYPFHLSFVFRSAYVYIFMH